MINQSTINIKEKYGNYQIEAKGNYIVWYEEESGKWIGLAVTNTPIEAHKVIKAHEQYLEVLDSIK